MLAAIDAERIEDLFGEIPTTLRADDIARVSEAMSEMEAFDEQGGRAR